MICLNNIYHCVVIIMFSEILELVDLIIDVDENGFEILTERKTEVFAAKKSIRASEHYEAQKLGYKLSLMFIVKPYEYNNQEYVYYENKKYKVERTYEKDTENLELVCSKVV